MSKRKSRASAPNLPQETLERARRQAAIERGELPPEPEPEPAPPARETPAAPTATAASANPYRTVAARQRRAVAGARTGTRRSRSPEAARERRTELDAETVAELLENPTIEVSEDELRRDYAYVVADLRSMGLLAGGLIVTLVVLAQVLPH